MIKAFNYFGSKNSPAVARWIVSNLPEHDRYLEPFGGSAAILLNKQPCQEERYSDIYELTPFFLQYLRFKPKELSDWINYLLEETEDYEEFTAQLPEMKEGWGLRAAKFYLYCHYSWCGGGTKNSTGFSPDAKRPDPFHLIEAANRLQNIVIKKQDAFEAIAQFPKDDRSLIYADPTYDPKSRKSKDKRHKDRKNSAPRRQYKHELTVEQHIELAKLLSDRSVVISGYDSELYNDLYKGWEKRSLKHAGDTEIIWISPIAQRMTAQLSINFGVLA